MCYSVLRLRPGLIFASLGLMLCLAMIFAGLPGHIIQTTTQQRRLPIYSVEIDERKISLGINCAWGDEDIPAILEILDSYNIRASFFVTGTFVRKFPESVRLIHEAGHEIGSHSNNHVDLTALDRHGIEQEIRNLNREVKDVIGIEPILFRTPSGAYNNLVIEVIESEGMIPIQWDADSLDYRDPTPDEMKKRIMDRLRPGSITLFHAGAKNTPAALPSIIEAVSEQGYTFVAVGELIHPPPYTLDHEGRQHRG